MKDCNLMDSFFDWMKSRLDNKKKDGHQRKIMLSTMLPPLKYISSSTCIQEMHHSILNIYVTIMVIIVMQSQPIFFNFLPCWWQSIYWCLLDGADVNRQFIKLHFKDQDPVEKKFVVENIFTGNPMVFIMDPKVTLYFWSRIFIEHSHPLR